MLSAHNSPLKPIQIVLDIDETIAYRDFTRSDYQSFFQSFDYNFIANGNETCFYVLLFPGVVEFIQFLAATPNVELSFFSYAVESANLPFVEKLLKVALGNDHPFSPKVKVFSNHHLRNDLKDLTVINKDLSKMLFVDDNFNFIKLDQRNNVHCITSVKPRYAKTKNIDCIFTLNHIFYLTGLLKKVFASDHNYFLASFHRFIHIAQKDYTKKAQWNYFLEGMAELKKFNPDLEFILDKSVLDAHGLSLSVSPQLSISSTAASIPVAEIIPIQSSTPSTLTPKSANSNVTPAPVSTISLSFATQRFFNNNDAINKSADVKEESENFISSVRSYCTIL